MMKHLDRSSYHGVILLFATMLLQIMLQATVAAASTSASEYRHTGGGLAPAVIATIISKLQ